MRGSLCPPEGAAELAGAVARLTGSARERQSWLQRSLRTKDSREANIRAKPVLIEFDQILERAKALAGPRQVRTKLSDSEIKRIARVLLRPVPRT